jgi:hypothetical protein
MAESRVAKYKMNLEHHVMPENKAEPVWKAPIGQIWDNMGIKRNNSQVW